MEQHLDIIISKGTPNDIGLIENLYDELNDYLASHINYPGWGKGSYPVRQQAEEGVAGNTLYIARDIDKVAGSIILNHTPDYKGAVCWGTEVSSDEAFYLHTFVVHPDYFRCGIGGLLLDFAYETANCLNMKTIRLDVYENNVPAINLYEKHGFKFIERVDLGLGCFGLDWFRLYEKPVLLKKKFAKEGE